MLPLRVATVLGLVIGLSVHRWIASPIDRADLLKRFHAREGDGPLLSGAAAFAAMWRAIPALRPVGELARNKAGAIGAWLSDASFFLFGFSVWWLMAVALRVVSDRAAAEDVLQEVFVTVWNQSAVAAPGQCLTLAWLCVVTRNRAIDQRCDGGRDWPAHRVEQAFFLRQHQPDRGRRVRQYRDRVCGFTLGQEH